MQVRTILTLRKVLGIFVMVGGLGLFTLVLPAWFWTIVAGVGLVALGWAIFRLDDW